MKTRIENKNAPRAESTFNRITSPGHFKSSRVSLADESARLPAKGAVEHAGRIKNEIVPERTGPPLKMVLFAEADSSSQDRDSSAWRALIKALCARGHRLLILERKPKQRQIYKPATCAQSLFYNSVKELKERFTPAIRAADFVMMSSNVAEGAAVGEWVTHVAQGSIAFYDLNTPETLARLSHGESEHLSPSLLSRYHLYLSLTGGPLLDLVTKYYGSPMVRPLYGSVDASLYFPEKTKHEWELGYSGNFNEDRMPGVDELLLEPARNWPAGRFAVAGQGFSQIADWPKNVNRFAPLAAGKERSFYNSQKFSLNITGAEMIDAGFSPSLRIFEAAACGTPIISDYWEGLETFFEPDEEILFARSAEELLDHLRGIGEDERLRIGDNARRRILAEHSAEQRAFELETYAMEALVKV
jgi:spore maturation protein CgeB